ncbi:MAG: substrate-binding domain-containing protein [Acidothermus cellulolyticus]|nr:substrate-binding domain-containing protein [Acidothermus cellulolyticus]
MSVGVVSRVLNPGSGPVAADTRARVMAAIEKLAYRPRYVAQALGRGRSDRIGLLLADLANPFFAYLADRLVWEARGRGVQVVLMTHQEDSRLEGDLLDALLDQSVGALIATPTGGNIEKWRRLLDAGLGLVFADRSLEALPHVDTVSISNKKSAEVATRHLVDLGHSRIGFISGPSSTSTGRDRIAGYLAVLRSSGIDVDPALICEVPFRGSAGADAVSALLALPQPPTALIVANTAQVRFALHRLKHAGVAIPDDLSVIVFDDNPWIELVSPPLTAVRQPIDLLAVHCLERAVSRAAARGGMRVEHVSVDAEFVRRASTAGPRVERRKRRSNARSPQS